MRSNRGDDVASGDSVDRATHRAKTIDSASSSFSVLVVVLLAQNIRVSSSRDHKAVGARRPGCARWATRANQDCSVEGGWTRFQKMGWE